jgi:organic radical activating enzyme
VTYNCLEGTTSLYVERHSSGYVVSPCCLYKAKHNSGTVPNIEDLIDNPAINKIKEGFKGDWKRPECIDCILKESSGKSSKRIVSLERGNTGITHWDIRPGSLCNLKCAMCTPWNSSKWYEDIDIFKKYNGEVLNEDNRKARDEIDWDWIYENCIDKAISIYIAGGEPFYMKDVQKFIKNLSKHEWNRNNTILCIQTNGVSNTPKFLEILSKFNHLEFSISCDGWSDVNDLIRFPTKHDEFLKNTQELVDLNCEKLFFNITVQAMNLPNIDTLVDNIQKKWNGKYDIHKLTRPNQLQVNALKPHIVERVLEQTKVPELRKFYSDYKFNEQLNLKMQQYLLELDSARGTDSKKIIPWCFE